MILKKLEDMVTSKLVAPKFKIVKLSKYYSELDYKDICLNIDGGIICYECAQHMNNVTDGDTMHKEGCCCTLCWKCKSTRLERSNPSIDYSEFNETHFFECLEVLEWCGDYARAQAYAYLHKVGFDDCLYLYFNGNKKFCKIIESSSFMVSDSVSRIQYHRNAVETILNFGEYYEKVWGSGLPKYEINKILEYLYLHSWKSLFDMNSRITRSPPFGRLMDGYLGYKVLVCEDTGVFKIIYNNKN